ncbi:MAG: aldehyde dehydrogenase family protein [Betaproteobacteria bacterium]|nr:aldehyde dehydrogenase family protein [Betaproteobacteria bacterium]
MSGLSIRGLSAGYGPIRVLQNVDLEAPEGEITVVVGPNGAGKTTLLKAVSGLIPREGAVLLDGEPLPPEPSSIVSRGLAQVAEGRQLFPQMSVRENLELGAYLLPRGEREARLQRIYEFFPKLAQRREQLAGTMSGGEQQMLAVGRALMGKPRLLMLDEPSLGLAPKMIDELLGIVRRIRDEGVTILLVEQNVAKAMAIAEGAYVIERGVVVMKGQAGKLLKSERLRAAYLGADTKPGTLTWKGGLFMAEKQTTAVTIAAENAWRGKVFTGRWQLAKGGTREVREPATGNVLTEVGFADAEDVREAAQAAAAAQVEWANTPADQRGAVLRRAAQLLEAHAESMRGWIVRETGSIPPKADFELHMVTGILLEAAAIATQPPGMMLPSGPKRMSFARRVPHGVVGVISPFNAPLILSARAVAPALALGNAVVLKPDPSTPVTGGFMLARLFEAAGLPAGLLHVLPGDAKVGEAMITDPAIAMISFTGSTAAGKRVGELASRHLKRVTLELGGKNSTIVLDDADLDVAASSAAWGAYLHQGQICMATGTVLAQRSIARELTERLVAKAKHLPVGDPSAGPCALGPIINARQIERIDGIVKDAVAKGAVLRAGGTYDKLFYSPTVLEGVRPDMRVYTEEVFGPVLTVLTFDTDEEAIAMSNATEYGLSTGVITQSVERAMAFTAKLRSGIIHVNDQTVADEPWVPFGGRGASGNGGRHGGVANWEEFTQWQWVTIQDKATPYPF